MSPSQAAASTPPGLTLYFVPTECPPASIETGGRVWARWMSDSWAGLGLSCYATGRLRNQGVRVATAGPPAHWVSNVSTMERSFSALTWGAIGSPLPRRSRLASGGLARVGSCVGSELRCRAIDGRCV